MLPEDLEKRFLPDYTISDLHNLGVFDSVYKNRGPRLASLGAWKPEWVHPKDPKGFLQWMERFQAGRRMEDDERQIKRWLNFKSRHGGALRKKPTPRRAFALQNWAIDPLKIVTPEQQASLRNMMAEYKARMWDKYERGLKVNRAPIVLPPEEK
jgi:8-oxo-dGTP pyrophosphatase MutT (NUDIX family)